MQTFFYGLFMDVDILSKQGITPESFSIGWVHNFALRISERATLVPKKAGLVYGTLMDIPSAKVEALYAEKSITDYVPEQLRVITEGAMRWRQCAIIYRRKKLLERAKSMRKNF